MDIVAKNLTKKYIEKTVLELDSLSLKKGSLSGIIGPNGAGKSTLINIIAGLENQTSGQVFYDGKEEACPPLKDMTLVFQNPYMLRTTVEKNIAYPLKLRGWTKEAIDERVALLCKELGLTQLKNQKSWKLSGGETQKLALARALSFKPKLLLLDEPTANIDPGTTGEIERILKRINEEEGITVLIITHNLAQARRLCKEVIFMNQGKIIEAGPSEEILKEGKNPLTRSFVAGELLT